MKSYGYLYEVALSDDNRLLAVKAARQSKRIRRILKQRHLSCEVAANNAYVWISKYENTEHTSIEIYDGMHRKPRTIIVPTLEELVVQHCVAQAMIPMFRKGMYEHTYAGIPGRGAHKAKKVIERWIRNDTKNVKYVLKMDIHHFFESIQHDILKSKLASKIRDEKMLDLLYRIINVTDEGLPLGFYTSQWLANWYLQDLDHFIKEKLCAVHYVRYMDDMVIFGSNKKTLHEMRIAISSYLKEKLGLQLKDNWQVFRFSYGDDLGRDLDFMGFRFYRTRSTLRKSIMYKATRKAAKISSKKRPTIYDARQMISYLGWVDCTDTYKMYVRWIKTRICFRALIRQVSRWDKCEDFYRIYRLLTAKYRYKGGFGWT